MLRGARERLLIERKRLVLAAEEKIPFIRELLRLRVPNRSRSQPLTLLDRARLFMTKTVVVVLLASEIGTLVVLLVPASKAEAASLAVASATSETEQNTASTSYVASDTSIASGSLPAGTYFVTWGAEVANNSASNVSNGRLVRGSTELAAISYEAKAGTVASDGIARSGYWLGALSGSEALTIEYSGTAGTTYIDSKFIKAIRLDDKLVEDSEYFTSGSQESSSDEVTNAGTAGWTDVKSLTKTFGSSTQNYLVFASMEMSPDSTANDCSARLEVDGVASMTSTMEGEDVADVLGFASAKVYSVGSGSKTVKLQGQSVGTATCDFRRSRIYMLRSNIFDQVVENYSSAESTLASSTWTDKNSQSYTPNQSETVMVMGSRIQGADAIGCVISTRYDDGAAQYLDTTSYTPNNTTDYFIGMSAMSATVSSATTFKMQFRRFSGTCTVKVKEATLIIWSMTLKPSAVNQSAYRWFSNTVGSTQEWWNSSWLNRRKISLNNLASTENLTNFPIRVSLTGTGGGQNIDYAKTKNAGEDIRFVDADNSTQLKYEIEKWDESGTSETWVKVPQIDSGSAADYIWMYYNNTSATDAQDAANVWDSNYNQVYHMRGTSGSATLPDSTSPAQNSAKLSGTGAGEPANTTSGQVSEAQDFAGDNDYAQTASPGLPTGDFTYETWVHLDANTDEEVFMASNGSGGNELGVFVNATKIQVFLNNSSTITATTTAVATGQWTHITVTRSGSSVLVYFNGTQDATTGTQAATLDFSTCQLLIGTDADATCNGTLGNYLDGRVDEARISGTARSAEWVEATAISGANTMNTFGPEDAKWWDTNWSARRKVTFDNSASAENLTDFPARVALAGSGGSQNIDYGRTKDAGEDIRFVDGDGTVLKYEIEKWNESGTSDVWVKVPQINSGSTTDYIWMYYGYAGATDAQDAVNVWNTGYKAVYHMKENPATTCNGTKEVCDSTTNANHADANGTMTSGDQVSAKIDGGLDLDGTNDYLSAPNSTSLNITGNAVTVEGWVNPATASPSGSIAFKSDDTGSAYYGATFEPTNIWAYADTGGAGWNWDTGQTLSLSWHHVAYVYDGTNQRLYVDGSQVATHALTGSIADSSSEPLWMGRNAFTGYMQAIIDEVRVSSAVRSADWVEATYKSQNNQMNAYSALEQQTSFTPLAAANAAYTLTADGQAFRLRMLLHASDSPLLAGDRSFKLQTAQKSGTCDAAYSGESYSDVSPSSGAIRYNDNSGETDGSDMIADPDDPTHNSDTVVGQTYEESNNFTSTYNVSVGRDGKWEFALVDFSAASNVSYCFRVVESGGGAIGTPGVVPEITTANTGSAPDSPTSLVQKKTDDSTLSTGAWTNETSIKLDAAVTDADVGDTIKICAEVDPVGTAFSSPAGDGDGCSVSGVSSGGTATVTISGLSADTEYHWQVKAKDAADAYSSWVTYGGNTENPPTNPAARDFGVDTTAPTGGTVYDGTNTGVDETFNDNSLSSLSANWSGFSSGVSGLARYEYSIGTTADGTQVKGWTNNTTNTSVTATGLTLQTSVIYYVNVRAVDNAGNVQSAVSSNGQLVAPSLTFAVSPASLTFANLNAGNSYTDTKTTTLTTSTNAYGGYVVRLAATDLLRSGSFTVPDFSGGTYASPDTWQTGDVGFGYTSSDASVQGSNKFQNDPCPGGTALASPGCYASYSQVKPGDIVADHTANVTGTPISNQAFTITHRVTGAATQAAATYTVALLYAITAIY